MTDTAEKIGAAALHDAATLAQRLGGTLHGENRVVTGLLSPGLATPEAAHGGVMVLEAAQLAGLDHNAVQTLGALVISAGSLEPALSCPVITVADTRLAFAQLSALFTPPLPEAVIAETAVIHPEAHLGLGVSIGARAVVGAGVQLGTNVRIGAGCVLGAGAILGEGTLLHANVTLYPGVQLGARVILHSGVVIGGDGFGYAFGPQGALKIYHHGTVVLGYDVEVGANSCIDRGTLQATRVGARTKIDNLCQIGHNVVIGSDCVIAGATAVGGSTVLGRGVVLGGQVGVTDHVQLGDGVRVGGGSSVLKSIPAGETWAGYPAQPHRRWVREHYLLGKLGLVWNYLKYDLKAESATEKAARETTAGEQHD